MKMRADCIDRHTQNRRDLLVALLFLMVQNQNRAFVGTELRERPVNTGRELLVLQCLLGVAVTMDEAILPARVLIAERDVFLLLTGPEAARIDGNVHDDSVEISLDPGISAKGPQAAIQPQKYLLREVVDALADAHEAVERTKDHVLMLVDQTGKRLLREEVWRGRRCDEVRQAELDKTLLRKFQVARETSQCRRQSNAAEQSIPRTIRCRRQSSMNQIFFSPFLIPIVAMLIPIVAIIAAAVQKVNSDRLRSGERLALLARGIPIDEVERILRPQKANIAEAAAQQSRPAVALRTASQIRLTAIILMCSGISLAAFLIVVALVLHNPDVYAGAASGIVPFGVGVGFLVDYRARCREIEQMREGGAL